MKYIETRHLFTDKLRALCIRCNWYTRGTNADYSALMDSLMDEFGYPVEITTDKLVEIATDIMEHSVITDYTMDAVLFELARACTTYFEVA